VKCGFRDVEKKDLFTSLTAARTFVQDKKMRPMLFLEEEALEESCHLLEIMK